MTPTQSSDQKITASFSPSYVMQPALGKTAPLFEPQLIANKDLMLPKQAGPAGTSSASLMQGYPQPAHWPLQDLIDLLSHQTLTTPKPIASSAAPKILPVRPIDAEHNRFYTGIPLSFGQNGALYHLVQESNMQNHHRVVRIPWEWHNVRNFTPDAFVKVQCQDPTKLSKNQGKQRIDDLQPVDSRRSTDGRRSPSPTPSSDDGNDGRRRY